MGLVVSSSLRFCSPQLRVPHPMSPLGTELPSQLWEHLLVPTTALRGQLSLVRLRLSLEIRACFALTRLAVAL